MLAAAIDGLEFRDEDGVSHAVTAAYNATTDTIAIAAPAVAGSFGNNIEFSFIEVGGDDVTLTFDGTITGQTAHHLEGGQDAVENIIRVGKGNLVRIVSTVASDLVVEFAETEAEAAIQTALSAVSLTNRPGYFLRKPSTSDNSISAVFIAQDEYMNIFFERSTTFAADAFIRVEITEDA